VHGRKFYFLKSCSRVKIFVTTLLVKSLFQDVAASGEEDSESDGKYEDSENDSNMEEERGGDGEDEEEDVSFGDDQMFQLDATLGAYFNSLKNGGSKKMNEQERIGHVMRVLACINVLIKKQSQSPNLLKIPAILLTVLSIGRNREIPTLVQKINGLLEIMVKCRCVPEAEHADELEFQLRRALYLASRHDDPQVRRAAINGYIYLVRASLQNEDCKHLGKDSVLVAFSDYFDKKKSKLGIQFFQQLLTRLPRISEFIIPNALNKCNSARNNFMRGTGIAILEFAVKNASEGIDEIFCRVSSDVEKLFFDIIANSADKSKSYANVIKAAQGLAQAMRSKGLGFAKMMSHAKAKKALQALDEVATKTPKGTNLARLVDSLYNGCVTEPKEVEGSRRRKRASQNLLQKKARQ
jgi:hypothetical protein